MKNAFLPGLLTLICLLTGPLVRAQTSETVASLSPTSTGVPIEQLITVMARKTGKRFVVDPRVHANVTLIGTTPAELTYPDFLTVLYVHGYAAIEDGKLVEIVPDANLRMQAIPTITAKDTRPGSEYVCEILTVKHASAAQLVPILRPLMVQHGHMAVYPAGNTMILCDRFASVRRLEDMIRTFDTPENAKPPPGTANGDSQNATGR